MVMYLLAYILFAITVGLLAIGRPGGFPLYFVLSFVLTPIIALLILLISSAPSTASLRGDRSLDKNP